MINLHSHDFCGAGMNSSTSFILSVLPDVVTFYCTRKGGTRFLIIILRAFRYFT